MSLMKLIMKLLFSDIQTKESSNDDHYARRQRETRRKGLHLTISRSNGQLAICFAGSRVAEITPAKVAGQEPFRRGV